MPAAALVEIAGELFSDGGSGKALGVVNVEVLDSVGESFVIGVGGLAPLLARTGFRVGAEDAEFGCGLELELE